MTSDLLELRMQVQRKRREHEREPLHRAGSRDPRYSEKARAMLLGGS